MVKWILSNAWLYWLKPRLWKYLFQHTNGIATYKGVASANNVIIWLREVKAVLQSNWRTKNRPSSSCGRNGLSADHSTTAGQKLNMSFFVVGLRMVSVQPNRNRNRCIIHSLRQRSTWSVNSSPAVLCLSVSRARCLLPQNSAPHYWNLTDTFPRKSSVRRLILSVTLQTADDAATYYMHYANRILHPSRRTINRSRICRNGRLRISYSLAI